MPLAAAAALTAALLPGSGSARALVPPNNTTEPSINGQAIEGRTLTANPGTWSGSTPMTFTYRWLRCPTDGGAADGSNCLVIGGATSNSYRLRDTDVGLRIRVRVTAQNADGSDSAASNPTGIVQGSSKPNNLTPPSIAGDPVLGQTLTADPGVWSGTQPITFSYQWRSCNRQGGSCQNIAGAVARTYNLRQTDVGTTLRIRVTARNSIGTTRRHLGADGGHRRQRTHRVPRRQRTDQHHPADAAGPPARGPLPGVAEPDPALGGGSHVGFRVTACGGRAVAGALVYVTAVPYNQFAHSARAADGRRRHRNPADGPPAGFPAANNQTLLVMFVRARKGGEPVLAGISTRRLISFRLAK